MLRTLVVFGRRHTIVRYIAAVCLFDLSLPYKVLVRAVDNGLAVRRLHNRNVHKTGLQGVRIHFGFSVVSFTHTQFLNYKRHQLDSDLT